MRGTAKTVAVLGVVAALAAAGCGKAASTTNAGSKKVLACMVIDVGGIHDKSFNQSAWQGMLEAQAAAPSKINIKYLLSPQGTSAEYQSNISAFIADKCGIIVTVGFSMATATQQAAGKNPNQKFAIVDNQYKPAIKNVDALVFDTVQDGFLGGYLAAGMTKTGIVATYGGEDFGTVTIYEDGFWDGVQYYNAKHHTHVKVLGWSETSQKGVFANSFTDLGAGESIANTFIGDKADIIFPVAGAVGLGTATAVKNADAAGKHVNMMWVDTDGCVSDAAYCKYFITSVTKGITVSVKGAVLSAANGHFKGGSYIGTLSNGGVTLSPFHAPWATQIPSSLVTELNQVKAGIENGTIPTPTKNPV